ncbi:MAG: NUMOD3 domain-containing DNA-binding protein [Patescibacteria group bacterium]|jgi:hypothetical protein
MPRGIYKRGIIHRKFHSRETKRKIGLANKGHKHTREFSEKLRLRMLGKKIHISPHTEETKRKISQNRKGKGKHIHKKTLLYGYKKQDERNDSAYQNWSKQIKIRDEWKCRINNNDCFGKVIAHHILSWRDFPELRYKINNGITLCQHHHPRKRIDETKLIPFFQGLVEVK